MGMVPFWARVEGLDELVLVIGSRRFGREEFLYVNPATKQLRWLDSIFIRFEKLHQEKA